MAPEVSPPFATRSFISNSFYYLTFLILLFIYIFLFALTLWLFTSLYCYIVEIIVWFLLESHVRSSPGSLIDIMIPDLELRSRMKVAVSGLLDRFKGISDEEREGQNQQELRAMNYFTSEMKSHSRDCAICLEDFVDGDSCRILIVCNHIFHSNCIDQWLKYQLTCQICQKPVDM